MPPVRVIDVEDTFVLIKPPVLRLVPVVCVIRPALQHGDTLVQGNIVEKRGETAPASAGGQ